MISVILLLEEDGISLTALVNEEDLEIGGNSRHQGKDYTITEIFTSDGIVYVRLA